MFLSYMDVEHADKLTDLQRRQLKRWLYNYGVDSRIVYRVELHKMVGYYIKVFTYKRENGRLYEVKMPPYDVLVVDLPPVEFVEEDENAV